MAEEAARNFEPVAQGLRDRGISLYGMDDEGRLCEDAPDGRRFHVRRCGREFKRLIEIFRSPAEIARNRED